MPERIDDPSFKLNDEAINKVYGQDDFSFAGHIYHKSGGDTFREYGEIPGATVRLAPDEAARLNAQRLESSVSDHKRQEYLRKREEWHNTPDTPSMAPELEHRHDAPAPHPGVKPVADVITGAMAIGAGGLIAKSMEKGGSVAAGLLNLPSWIGKSLGGSVGNKVEELFTDGWYKLSPHKDI